jgi:methyl-accepting chemotaxis protein
MARAGTAMYAKSLEPVVYLNEVYRLFLVNQNILRDMMFVKDSGQKGQLRDQILKNRQLNNDYLARYEATGLSVQDRSLFDAYQKATADHGTAFDRMIELAYNGQDEEALARVNGEGKSLFQKRLDAIDAMMLGKESQAGTINASSIALANNARMWIVAFIAAGLTVSMIIALLFSTAITSAVALATRLAGDIASGDLSFGGEYARKLSALTSRGGEMGTLTRALWEMGDRIRGVVIDVKTASDNVAAGSVQLSQGAQSTSRGATEQASTDVQEGGAAVAETVSAMKDIAGRVTIIE